MDSLGGRWESGSEAGKVSEGWAGRNGVALDGRPSKWAGSWECVDAEDWDALFDWG